MTDLVSVIKDFNNKTIDFFNYLIQISSKVIKNKDLTNKITNYKRMYELSYKVNASFPLDHFCEAILPYNREIYSRSDDYFLNKNMNDIKITVNNEFSMISPNEIKDIWLQLNNDEIKNNIRTKLINLTNCAELYFRAYLATYQ
jgi:hypothetical protein